MPENGKTVQTHLGRNLWSPSRLRSIGIPTNGLRDSSQKILKTIPTTIPMTASKTRAAYKAFSYLAVSIAALLVGANSAKAVTATAGQPISVYADYDYSSGDNTYLLFVNDGD